MKVLITGATGLIGKEIGKALIRDGHSLVIIARDLVKARRECPFPCEIIEGDLVAAPLSSHFFDGVEGVIHLMGEPIADGRWSEKKKKLLVETRLQSTRNLRTSLNGRAKVLVSSSAIGIYGNRGDEELSENSAPGTDFLAELCVGWEKEARAFAEDGTRVVTLRTGVVLSDRGGALNEMLTPYRAGIGGKLGDGKQWMSWIHIDDIVGLYLHALDSEGLKGPINAVAPSPVRNEDFVKCLGAILHRPVMVPTPQWGLQLLFGEKSVILTASQKVSSTLARRSGYEFKYTELKKALENLLAAQSRGEDLFYAEQYVPLPPEQIFPFFAQADNLGRLTPPLLNFKIDSTSTIDVREGTLIDYTLKVHGVPLKWKTQIEEWTPPKRFVDNQLKGPYKLWHHTHSFEEFGRGTLMTDRVRYILPVGYLGWLGGMAFIRGDVEKIFAFRREVIDRLFTVPAQTGKIGSLPHVGTGAPPG